MNSEENMSAEQKELIGKLRQKVQQEMEPDMCNDSFFFYRFLKARDFNLDDAEKMLRKHLEWRKEKKVKNMLTEYKMPEVIKNYFPYSSIGFDKEGSACCYINSGNFDAKGLLRSCTEDDFERACIYLNENEGAILKQQSKKLGRNIDSSVYIQDFEKLTFSKATDKTTIDLTIRMITLYQNNYPERLKALYIINSSIYVNIIFSIVKHFMASSILEKIHMFGKDGWKEALLKVIDADELPAFLGGNKTDPDGNPMCNTFVCHCGSIPESYYIRKSKRSFIESPEFKKLTLPRASLHEVLVDVKEPNSFIEWKFQTKYKDIRFGVFYKEVVDEEKKMTKLVPLQVIDREECPEVGMYPCEKAGIYAILFDNSGSWLRSKQIDYSIAVINPKDHAAEFLE